MYRRKRRSKYIWLPSRYASYETLSNATPTTAHNGTIQADGDASVTLQLAPVLLDSNIEATDVESIDPTNVTIADIVQSNEYFIKRICGNLWLAVRQDSTGGGGVVPAALVTAGLFVARVDSSNHLQPAGAVAGAFGNFDPQHPDTLREPWIWRRTWILANTMDYTSAGASYTSSYPWAGATNWYPTDNRTTGSGIDQKTARRVKSDERLFLAISARAWPPNAGWNGGGLNIDFTYEFRVLGALRRPSSRGVF